MKNSSDIGNPKGYLIYPQKSVNPTPKGRFFGYIILFFSAFTIFSITSGCKTCNCPAYSGAGHFQKQENDLSGAISASDVTINQNYTFHIEKVPLLYL